MTLKPLDILQPLLLRVCLALAGLASILRLRMEVSSPPTSFDHLSDTAFLLKSGTDPSSLPYFPALLLPFHIITGGEILSAVFLGAIADAMSGVALYHLTLQLNLSRTNARDVATMFLWNPLTIASCISGSADPLRLTSLFVAAAAAAAGSSAVAGACLAAALHFIFFSSSQIMLMAVPLIALVLRKQQNSQTNKNTRSKSKDASPAADTTMIAASFSFLVGFLVASSVIFLTSQYIIYGNSGFSSLLRNGGSFLGVFGGIFNFFLPFQDFSTQQQEVVLSQNSWSNIEPNIGLQWYLFSEVLPPFRYLYQYIFWAVPIGLNFSIALRFSYKTPLTVLVAQGIVLCMLGHHPTYSDIMWWVSLMPIVLLVQRQGQENKKKNQDGGGVGGGGDKAAAVKMWLAIGFCISLGLNTAAYELWLTLGTGNANFFYGMNLLWAAWQALALVQLLKSTAAAEDA